MTNLNEGILEIPLDVLLEYADPTLDDPWDCGRIHSEDVKNCIRTFKFRNGAPAEYEDEIFQSYEYNVERIAYFLEEGWSDAEQDDEPVSVDIGLVGYTPGYLIMDGNHRVAAAKIRGDKTIRVEITGDLDKAEAVFFNGVHPDDYQFYAEESD